MEVFSSFPCPSKLSTLWLPYYFTHFQMFITPVAARYIRVCVCASLLLGHHREPRINSCAIHDSSAWSRVCGSLWVGSATRRQVRVQHPVVCSYRLTSWQSVLNRVSWQQTSHTVFAVRRVEERGRTEQWGEGRERERERAERPAHE